MARRRKEINIQMVARQAGVSVATVSRVVNNRTDVSEALRKRIMEVIAECNFTPNKSVERVCSIGVVVVSKQPLLTEYPSQLITGMTNYSVDNSADMAVIMDCGEERRKPLLQLIREHRCDAVCILMAEAIEEELASLEAAAIPTMLINMPRSGNRLGFVNNDAYPGALAAVRHLVEMGHRKVGFLHLSDSENHRQRFRGYVDALGTVTRIEPSWLAEHIPTRRGQEAGYLQTMRLFEQAPGLTAIVCSNDEMAMGCYKACFDAGRRIPDDISVIGFDDLPFASYLTPALSTVRQPLTEMGFKVINYLDAYLKGHLGTLPCETIPTEFIIRDSVANIH